MCHRDVFGIDGCVNSVDVSCVSRWFVLSERFSIGDDMSSWKFLSNGNRCFDSMHRRVLLSDDTGADCVSGRCDVCGWNIDGLRHRM